jgi:anhydro-N-acetylmuramic acid kinase
MKQSSLYIGLMSGTSLDGIDIAMVEFKTRSWHVIETAYQPFPAEMREKLLGLCNAPSLDVDLLGRTDGLLGQLYAEAVLEMLLKSKLPAKDIVAIGSHGQTIRHRPLLEPSNSRIPQPLPYTLQIGDPNIIAERTGITTVADFRRRDLAAGGQGAPLVPAFHAYALHSAQERRGVLNIGGIANITRLSDEISGFDTGPGNTLIDAWTQLHFQKSCDQGGELAANGVLDRTLLAAMMADPYFQMPPPKSTGREYFNLQWLKKYLPASGISALDVLATLTHLTAHSIADAIRRFVPQIDRVLVCGGGTHNDYLMMLLAGLLAPRQVGSTQEAGLDPDFVEATAFAWLAKQTLEHKPGNLTSVTGARKAVILGGVYYGNSEVSS